jgi:hypothetical protein
MRLAHTNATQQLTDWRVVLMHDGRPLAACSGADYCLVKLKNAYDGVDGSPALDPDSPPVPKELPDGTRIKEVTFDAERAEVHLSNHPGSAARYQTIR